MLSHDFVSIGMFQEDPWMKMCIHILPEVIHVVAAA